MCKFLHIRKYNDNLQIQGRGGVTVAYDDLTNGCWMIAIARCHEKDNFNKRLGRVKAEGRLMSRDQFSCISGFPTEQDLIKHLIRTYQ